MKARLAAALAVATAGLWTDRAFAAIVSMETLSGPLAGAASSDLPRFDAERTYRQTFEAAGAIRIASGALDGAARDFETSPTPDPKPIPTPDPTPVPTPPAAPLILLGLVAFAAARSFGPRRRPRKPRR
jgi:hypothetical protein